MIAADKKVEVLANLRDTLETMRSVALSKNYTPPERIAALKELGQMSLRYKALIAECDARGWDKYYQISHEQRQKHANQQPYTQTDGEVRAA